MTIKPASKILVGIAAGLLIFSGITTQPFVANSFATSTIEPVISSTQLQKHVKYLSVDMYPRTYDFPNNLNAAADYIKNQLTEAGITTKEQTFQVLGRNYRNIIVKFGPNTGKLLVIGAHYDSHGDAGSVHSGGNLRENYTPGADDNASGVAGLIELAKLLQKNPPSRPIELVAYTLEEPPFFRTEYMGSAQHAQSLVKQRRPVDMMISLEMIGYFNDAANSQDYPFSAMKLIYPNKGNFIAIVGRYADTKATRRLKSAFSNTNLPVRSINAPASLAGVDFSDHLNYWAHDMHALMVTDTAFMRNKQYHLAGDTYDRLDYDRMTQVVFGVYKFTQLPE